MALSLDSPNRQRAVSFTTANPDPLQLQNSFASRLTQGSLTDGLGKSNYWNHGYTQNRSHKPE